LFETPYAYALLAFAGPAESAKNGEAIGLALYFFNYSTWTGRPGLYLEDLYVKPAYRNIGIGKAFFGRLGKIAQEKNCPRLDWAVLKVKILAKKDTKFATLTSCSPAVEPTVHRLLREGARRKSDVRMVGHEAGRRRNRQSETISLKVDVLELTCRILRGISGDAQILGMTG